MLTLIENDPNHPDCEDVEMGKLLKENNPACLEKILQCFKIWIMKNKKWGEEEVKMAIEGGFINGKPNTKKLTVEICDVLY